MRRFALGALVTSLLVAGLASAAVAAGSEEADSRTTQIPGTGLAVTLPVDWRIWSPPEAAEAIVIASDVGARQSCEFALVKGSRSAEGAASESLESVEAHPDVESLGRTFLDVPAGSAVRVSYRHSSAPDEDRFILDEHYISGPDGVASVTCSSDDPPADRWLSIVEAIEVIGVEGAASRPFDPRVEVTDHGFAVDFGAGWLVRAWPGPGPLLGGATERDQWGPEMATSVLRAVTAEGGPTNAECWIEDDTDLPGLSDLDSPAAWQAALTTSAKARSQEASVPDVTEIDLASGRAVRADWRRWRGMPATAWVFLDGERRIVLFCRAADPPADAWLSIADTVEFLSAAEWAEHPV